MPLITIKSFEDELSAEQSKHLINKVTDAVREVTSEKLRVTKLKTAIGVLVVMHPASITSGE